MLGAGKGGGSLTEVAETHYLARMPENRLDGIAVTRHGYGRPTRRIPVVEAGHPVPDEAGLAGAESMLDIADAAGADDLVLVLLSGGASANLIAPASGITLRRKAGDDARDPAQRRQYRRVQLRAKTSVAHQRRPAGEACPAGAAS